MRHISMIDDFCNEKGHGKKQNGSINTKNHIKKSF